MQQLREVLQSFNVCCSSRLTFLVFTVMMPQSLTWRRLGFTKTLSALLFFTAFLVCSVYVITINFGYSASHGPHSKSSKWISEHPLFVICVSESWKDTFHFASVPHPFTLVCLGLSLPSCLAPSMNYELWSPQAPRRPQMDWRVKLSILSTHVEGHFYCMSGCSCWCKLSHALLVSVHQVFVLLKWGLNGEDSKDSNVNRCDSLAIKHSRKTLTPFTQGNYSTVPRTVSRHC